MESLSSKTKKPSGLKSIVLKDSDVTEVIELTTNN